MIYTWFLGNISALALREVQVTRAVLGYLFGISKFGKSESRWTYIPAAKVDVERPLQVLVRGEGDAELRRGAAHPGNGALPEGLEALLGVDLARSVDDAVVLGLAAPRHDLQPRLDDVSRRDERGGGHAGDGAGGQQRPRRVVTGLVGEAEFEVRVRREVDGGEGNVAHEARLGALEISVVRTYVQNPSKRFSQGSDIGWLKCSVTVKVTVNF